MQDSAAAPGRPGSCRTHCSSSPLVVRATTSRATRPARPAGAPAKGKKGGKLEQLGASDVDFLDPGQTYYSAGYQVLYATQTPLYLPKPGETDAVPALAEGPPEISDDKKSVTVTLKKGVKFAPPVNREIQAKDIKYGFERAFTKHVPNQYTTYFNFIEGAPAKPGRRARTSRASRSTRRIPTRSRSSSPKPQGAGFAASLVMPVTTPVPKEYAEKFDKETPSTYNENVVAYRPLHGRERRQGQAHRLEAGQVDPPRPQPELGREQGLPSRLPGRDHCCARTPPTPTCPAARCSRARTSS